MSVDKNTVKRIARLARLRLEEDRVDAMMRELNNMLAWVEQLEEVNIDGVAPLTSVIEQKLKMRDDVVIDGGYPVDLMKNAPGAEDNFFVVPKVVE